MAVPTRNVLSLCAGVGGLELGIALALNHRGEAAHGICYVEREAAAAASLVASMEAGWLHPAPVWSDLTTFDGGPWRGHVHILASGDPCQDNSVAGKRAGEEGERFLAPEVVRVARECRPDRIFRENVPGNADGQLAAIVQPLERLGYRVACGIFSSAETGNTMRRERLFILADLTRERCGEACKCFCRSEKWIGGSSGELGSTIGGGDRWDASDAGRGSLERTASDWAGHGSVSAVGGAGGTEPQGQQRGQHHALGWEVKGGHSLLSGRAVFPPAVIPGPTDSRWIDVLDRFPELQPALSEEEAESHLRRGIDAMANRVERLRATGNGVDPVAAAYAYLSLDALLATSGATG